MTRDKLKPVDYAFMIGGPAVFILLAIWGVSTLLGPAPAPNPIKLLRDQAVTPGMSRNEVIAKVGPPKAIIAKDDGEIYRYERSEWDPDRRTFSQAEADVEISASGTVTGVRFDSSTPPPSAP